MTLLDQLRQRRDTARQAAEQILTRAANEQRDLTPEAAVLDQLQQMLVLQVRASNAAPTASAPLRSIPATLLEYTFDSKHKA